MYAVELRTKITDGIIRIPERYRKNISYNVRVILLANDAGDTGSDIIEELLESPLKLPDFRPLKREAVYDRI